VAAEGYAVKRTVYLLIFLHDVRGMNVQLFTD
jgi:hypothetical protein